MPIICRQSALALKQNAKTSWRRLARAAKLWTASRERSAYRIAAARFVGARSPSAQTRRHVMSARAEWVRRKTLALFPSY